MTETKAGALGEIRDEHKKQAKEAQKRRPRTIELSLEEAQVVKNVIEEGGTIADVLIKVKHLFKVSVEF